MDRPNLPVILDPSRLDGARARAERPKVVAGSLCLAPTPPPLSRAQQLARLADEAAMEEVETLRRLLDSVVAQADVVWSLKPVPAGVRDLCRHLGSASRGAALNIDALMRRRA